MKKRYWIKYLTFISISLAVLASVPKANAQFANGADVSWVTQMEASNIKFYNSAGTQQDLFDVIKGKCINSIRLRVWVNPAGGWCNKADVVAKAIRAQNKGYRILIDFHYSDTWADPGHQAYPAAWVSDTAIGQLATDVYNHTTDVLDSLKANGITPEWVQVGNETNNGMLWDQGEASLHMNNFAQLITSGYNAVKAVSPTTKVIVHISNGYDNSLFQWMFDGLKSNGAKWDIIGMSLYPPTAGWATYNTECLANMNNMVSRYGKQVMIVEVGMPVTAVATCDSFLTDIIAKTKSVSGGNGLGVFYWEPECYNNWQGYGMGAFDNTGKPTAALNAFGSGCNQSPDVSITAPVNKAKFTAPASVTITATATDPDGTISSVAFYSGTTLLGTVTTSPYSFSWTNVPAGTYTIYIEATDNGGAVTTSAYTTITVAETTATAPPATITAATTTTFCSGGSVVLNANTGTGYTYRWNSGGTAINGATAASYTATISGSYTVTVTSGGLSTTSTSTVVTVDALPPYQSVMGVSAVCAGSAGVTYSITPTTGNTYTWTVPASVGTIVGSSAGNSVLLNIANAAGRGTIKVNVKNSLGCSSLKSDSLLVAVYALPAATITAVTSTTFCTGRSVVLNANNSTGLMYQWSNGASSITGATNTSYMASATGNYTVTVTDSANCSANSSATTVTEVPAPKVSTTDTTICSTTPSININTATASNTSSVRWSALSGSFSSASELATTYAPSRASITFGSATLILTGIANAPCANVSDTMTVTINAAPTVIITPANPTTSCDSIELYASAGLGYTYQWNNDSIEIAGATSSDYTVRTTGHYTVTVTDSNNCSTTSLADTASIYLIPGGAVIPDNYIYSAKTDSVIIRGLPTGIGKWKVVEGTGIFADSTSSTTTVNGLSIGANVMAWTTTNSCGDFSTNFTTIYVGYAPAKQTINGPDSVTANQTGVSYSVPDSAGYTYHWTLPPGATIDSANADSSSITVNFGTKGGIVGVTETNPFGTASSSLPISLGSVTSIIAGTYTDNYEVRPNPFSDYTTIIVHSPATERIILTIIDIQGTTCYSSSQYSTNQEFAVGKELSADGVYFVQLAFGNEVKVLKLVKIK